ncbi:MAG: transglutaminase domain-containing protein [Spirochaetota bacterium]
MTLFFSRLFLYLIAFLIPVFHPAIVVPYDLNGWWLWFVLVPGEMIIAFFLSPPKFKLKVWILAAVFFLGLSILVMSFAGSLSFVFIAAGVFAFMLTAVIFKTGLKGQIFAVVELFFLAFIYYKLLNFSRASETVARQSSGITQAILILSFCSFFIHSLVLYLAAFRTGKKGRLRKEIGILVSLLVPPILLFAVILPPDFVEHSVVLNNINQDIEPQTLPVETDGKGWDLRRPGTARNLSDRNLRGFPNKKKGGIFGNGENGDEGETGGKKSVLQGIPSDQWNNMLGTQGKRGKQYAVMVVASNFDPVYSAEGYYSGFDPVLGFIKSGDEDLNSLSYQRLVETWRNPDNSLDIMRYPDTISYISTISRRVLAYRPLAVEPTVRTPEYYPFDYTYNSVSQLSVASENALNEARLLTDDEKLSLDRYMKIPLEEADKTTFLEHLTQAIQGKNSYFEKIEGILKSFSEYQYLLGFDDEVSVKKMVDFLEYSKEGDCTEFSNTAAILGRLAGIPSRVVVGYLAASELQTLAHWQGLQELKRVIKPLNELTQKYLYLVTTAHHHSWVQYYIPDFGWIDFESTAYALPPPPGGDPNSSDVVIPIMQDNRQKNPVFVFPWRTVLLVLGVLSILILTGLYLTRYSRELYLYYRSGKNDFKGLKALYRLALMKLAAYGLSLKAQATTILEYADVYPGLKNFAACYTELSFREYFTPDEKERIWKKLRDSYRGLLAEYKQKGFKNAARRAFSLKGLHYY